MTHMTPPSPFPHRVAPLPAGRLPDEAVAAMIPLWDARSPDLPRLDDVAAAIGVPTAVLAKVVPSAEMLAARVVDKALATLNDLCMKAVVKVDPGQPIAQVQAVGVAFVDWVLADPRIFRLLVSYPSSVPSGSDAVERQFAAMRDLVMRLLRRAQEMGHLLPEADLDRLAFQMVGFAYGLAHLATERKMGCAYPCNATADDLHRAMAGVIGDLTACLAAQTETSAP